MTFEATPEEPNPRQPDGLTLDKVIEIAQMAKPVDEFCMLILELEDTSAPINRGDDS